MTSKPKQQPVYLVIGVPGSGKTWVSRKVAHKTHYIPHDLHTDDQFDVIMARLPDSDRPIITESPFMEKVIRRQLLDAGVDVRPYLVWENQETVQRRYEEREGRPIPQMHLTRVKNIKARAEEWEIPIGSSEEIAKMLDRAIPELKDWQEPSAPIPPTREEYLGIKKPPPLRRTKKKAEEKPERFERTQLDSIFKTKYF